MDVLNVHLPRLLDLASNFNIDLSGVLAGYAQKLRDDVPEMENFSFPEAALLLQHCAEIYGRKVDHVYNLAVELCENMNVRMYGPSGASEENLEDPAAITKKLGSKRRKTVVQISLEDFKFQKISLDKPKTITKHKRKKKHCREAVCVRLTSVNLLNSHELHIFEDDQCASIGTKDQFRLNWPIEQNCQIEEYIHNDGGSGIWDVMDVGVSNMPTPEYSDDGMQDHDTSPVDTRGADPDLFNECENTIPFASSETDSPEKANNVLLDKEQDVIQDGENNAVQDGENNILQDGDNNILLDGEKNVIQESILIPEGESPLKLVEKPTPKKKVTFQLPFELTKKGLKGVKEKNITLFLFSDYLRRELKMDGPLPPLTKDRNGDKKLVTEHVQNLKKRYKLEDKRKEFCVGSLLENQSDFLGFEEVILDDTPDTLSPSYCTNGAEDINEDVNADNNDFNGDDNTGNHSDTDNVLRNSCDDDNYDNILSFQENIQRNYDAQKKTMVDVEGVTNWRHFIQSKLSGEEHQTKFDVHEYGTNIINSFQSVGQTKPFADIVKGMDNREISRYFVSSLMMANTTNLILDHAGPDTLQLTLNHTQRYHEMEDILVPPTVGGLNPTRQSKRKADSESNDEESPDKRNMKQVPGSGPWKNKSKKGKEK